jgi:hypothetical protein
MSDAKGKITHVEVLLNEHPDAADRGFQPGDPLRPVYAGDLDLPEDEMTALRIVYGFLAPDVDNPAGGWDAHRFARLGVRYAERPLHRGDVVVIERERRFEVTDLDFTALPPD